MGLLSRASKRSRLSRENRGSNNNFYSGASGRQLHRVSSVQAPLAQRVQGYNNPQSGRPFIMDAGGSPGGPPGGGVGPRLSNPFTSGFVGGERYQNEDTLPTYAPPPPYTGPGNVNAARSQQPRDDDGGKMMTKMETYNMGLQRDNPDPFVPLPRLSMHSAGDTPRNSEMVVDPNKGKKGKHKQDDGQPGDGRDPSDVRGSDSNTPKFRRNVPPYYKVFELNSRFFLSGLGFMTLIALIFDIVALISAVESDPNIFYRQVPPHLHIACLAVIFVVLFIKYSFYLLNWMDLNRRLEMAHVVLAIFLLITLCLYGHWRYVTLPGDYHEAYEKDLGCGYFEATVKKMKPAGTGVTAPAVAGEELEPEYMATWYICGLIRNVRGMGTVCIAFSVLLLLVLIGIVIHALLAIQEPGSLARIKRKRRASDGFSPTNRRVKRPLVSGSIGSRGSGHEVIEGQRLRRGSL